MDEAAGSRWGGFGGWARRRAVLGSILVAAVAVIVATAALVAAIGPRSGAAAGREAERSAAVAALAAPGGALAGGQAAAQVVPGERPSVVVSGSGEASVPAESATVQFIVRGADSLGGVPMSEGEASKPFPTPPSGPTEEELAPIVEAIVAAGVPEADVVATAGSSFAGPYGPGSGQVVVTLGEELLGDIDAVVTAGTEAAQATDGALFVEFVGAAYGAADCSLVEADAREDAVDAARARAEALAEAVGLTLGDVLLVSDGGSYGPDGGLPVGCADEPLAEFSAGKGYSLSPFDPNAPAEVEVYAQLSLAYAIE